MTNAEIDAIRQVIAEVREQRDTLRPELDDLTGNGDERENRVQALWSMHLLRTTRQLADSSRRLERLTWVLAALTVALIVEAFLKHG